jgi:hypothetical protein
MPRKRRHDNELRSVVRTGQFPSYLERFPHVLIPSGFDEVRMGHLPPMVQMLGNCFTTSEARDSFNFDALPQDAYLPQPQPLCDRDRQGLGSLYGYVNLGGQMLLAFRWIRSAVCKEN